MSGDVWTIGLTLAVSGLAAAVAVRLRLPGGALIWALAAAAGLHISVAELGPLPAAFRTLAQILIGITIGTTVTRSPLKAVWALRGQLGLCLGLLLAACVGSGLLLARVTPLGPATGIFAVAPGGANDMAVASVHFGLDAALIAGFQVVRQLLVFVIVPVLFAVVSPPDTAPPR